jgi:(2Fe-2S) ferredoxin
MKQICFVCQNLDCKLRGAAQLMTEITGKVAADSVDAEVRSYACFGACDQGPHVVLYPQKKWYSRVRLEDLPDILDSLAGGPPVTRLDYIDRSLQKMIYGLLDTGIF